MKNYKRYTITAALPYSNGPIHIGHLAGAYLPPDIYTRYLRLIGKEVVFVCGSDEHGVPITLRARKEGIAPQEVVDRYHSINKKAFEDFGISFDIYHRTSDPLHHQTASDFFKTLEKKEVFEIRTTEQYYDEQEKQFLADRYITGTCPTCSNEHAYGDQCEKCGRALSPDELINPKSAISGNKPIKKKTEHWYLPLGKIQEEWLEQWVDSHKTNQTSVNIEHWKSNVYGQVKSWLDQGLQSRAVTRDLDWGVPVPVEGAEGKVLYVWFDAPIGYISATKAWAQEKKIDWEPYWKDEETKLVHFIGKDNIVFHCLIFPAMLKAHDDYILPENIPANEFLNLEGDKLSTSRNWAVWLHEYLEDFPNQQDVLRYCLISNLPETKDSEFTWKDFQIKNNSELVGVLGNYVNRIIVLTHKYCDGHVPSKPINRDLLLQKQIQETIRSINDNIETYHFRLALQKFMELARIGNQCLTEAEPWKLPDNDPKITDILFEHLQICAWINTYLQVFLPFSAGKLASILHIDLKNIALDQQELDILEPGTQLSKAKHLFSKVEDDAIEKQVEKLQKAKSMQVEKTIEDQKTNISFDDFMKMEIKVGTIKEAEKVPKADKLLKLQVDLGTETRTIVSGIAEHYQPEVIIGKQVSVITNLAPRKIRGVESKGMILMAEDETGKLAFVTPEKAMEEGSIIR